MNKIHWVSSHCWYNNITPQTRITNVETIIQQCDDSELNSDNASCALEKTFVLPKDRQRVGIQVIINPM